MRNGTPLFRTATHCLVALGLRGTFLVACAAQTPANVDLVQPVRWVRFGPAASWGVDEYQARTILLNNARYNLAWVLRSPKADPEHDRFLPPNMEEHGIRPGASVVYGTAVVLQTGIYDPKTAGFSEAEARHRITQVIRGFAASHKVNGSAKGWGDQWQSAHWASLLGQGAWMLWADLDPETRRMVADLVVHEADRFLAPGYKVPYWRNPDDHENYRGDTKAEENSWNSMVLQVAVAMMPRHPHAPAWKRVASELMVSAFSMKTDLQNPALVDGRPVRGWLAGYNVRDDGAVINHGILHPDYTATPTLQLRAYFVQSLAGQSIPQAAAFNAETIYRSFSLHRWPSPPCKAPGGPMYVPGRAEVYYPQGTDWSTYRFDIYYLFDTFADILGWDKGLPASARSYMRLRAARLLAMQARHPDGSAWTKAEAMQAYPNEAMLAWQMGDAYLLQWLSARHALMPVADWETAP